jgi:hypothetical protein
MLKSKERMGWRGGGGGLQADCVILVGNYKIRVFVADICSCAHSFERVRARH